MSTNVNISMSVIKRLPRYYRFLGKLKNEGQMRISSGALSEMMGTTASQIRQDLNCFGGFGQQGYGYNVKQLYDEIGKILGVSEMVDTIIIGVGNLGRALASHLDFTSRGFNVIGIFDKNPELSNTKIKDYMIYSSDLLAEFCRNNKPKVALICIPAENTEDIIDILVKNGVTGFWNFSHFDILAKYPFVKVQNVHLSDSLLTLGYQIKNDK